MEIATEPMKLADLEKTLKGDAGHTDKRGNLRRLRDEFIDDEVGALRHRANLPETSDEKRIEVLRRQQELRLIKKHPLTAKENLRMETNSSDGGKVIC